MTFLAHNSPATTGTSWSLNPDRGLPAEPTTRALARDILSHTEHLPIVSMHGHVDASLLADDENFPDPAALFITPDHYLVRMLVSQGALSVADLGLHPAAGAPVGTAPASADPREIWRRVCENWYLYRGTPTRYWLEEVLIDVFGVPERLSAETADFSYDHLTELLAQPEFRPRALFDRFGIELLSTTDAADAPLDRHADLARDGWGGRVIPTFRPDPLLEPLRTDWRENIDRLSTAASTDVGDYAGFIDAIRARRQAFVAAGARATDHSHLVADTQPVSDAEAQRLFSSALTGQISPSDAASFTAHMLFQMARMSADDGLVMQIHHGVIRSHNGPLAAQYGENIGFDIPAPVEFAKALQPILETFGHARDFRLIVFTIDETTYSRELAPLAGAYPAMRLGAPWWFLDAPEAMRRFREATVETAGFYNTTGFVDDTRAFCSIPARHGLSRRIDAGYLARLVAEHRLPVDEAIDTGIDLAYRLPKSSYPPIAPMKDAK